MISSQKKVEFTDDDYDNIKKVYTIWLVMDAPKGGSNSIRRYEIKEKILHGHGHEDVKNYDLVLTPVMEEELTKMGSLALGIAERAAAEGERRGIEKGEKTGEHRVMEAIRMLKDNLPLDTIVKKTGMTLQSLTELRAML